MFYVVCFVCFLFSVDPGRLRDSEADDLAERCWAALFETCLALPVFHEELTMSFAANFSALMFLKVFHWVAAGRVGQVRGFFFFFFFLKKNSFLSAHLLFPVVHYLFTIFFFFFF
jgi:hypothetical protein